MQERFVLFDFDGVIADSYALAFDVARQFNPELNDESYRALFEGNIYESLGRLEGWDSKNHPDQYAAAFNSRMKDEVGLAPGMRETIEKLAGEYRLIVISSTISMSIREFLDSHRLLKYFTQVMGMDVHTSKAEKMRMLFKKYDTAAEHCIFITDTLGDMREAQEHRMGTIGCSWGVHSHETLSKGIPFRIVDKPLELPDAVADYFARE